MVDPKQPKGFHAAFYCGTPKGVKGIYNRAVRAKERGRFSHVEIVFSDGVAASASFMDGGVRYKQIDFHEGKWVYVELPPELEKYAREWFDLHEDESYDLMGNFYQAFGFVPEARRKKYCSEAGAAALGISEAWRFGPNVLYVAVLRFAKPDDWPSLDLPMWAGGARN